MVFGVNGAYGRNINVLLLEEERSPATGGLMENALLTVLVSNVSLKFIYGLILSPTFVAPAFGFELVGEKVVVVKAKLYERAKESPRFECRDVAINTMYVVFEANPPTGVHENTWALSDSENCSGTDGLNTIEVRTVDES